MKIIKQGTPTPKFYIFKCSSCGCIFELNYHNIDDRRVIDLGPFMNGDFVTSPCPCCLETVYGDLKENQDG